MTSSWSSSILAAKKKRRSLSRGSTYKRARSCGNLRSTSSAKGMSITCPRHNRGAHLCGEIVVYIRVCHVLKLWTQGLSSCSCLWDRRMNFKPVFKVVLLKLILISENLDAIHLSKCKHLHMTWSLLAPLVFEGNIADIISWCRANSSPLKRIPKIDQTSMCRMQPRLVVRGAEGNSIEKCRKIHLF